MKSSPHPTLSRYAFIFSLSLLLGTFGAVLLKERVWLIQGSSMVPTFLDHQRLVILWSGNTPQRGDVVLVNVTDPDKMVKRVIIKRVIGVPGDRVRIHFGPRPVEVNGVALVEPYVNGIPVYTDSRDVTLGPGQYYVMGDNRDDSLDSRSLGPIRRHQVRHILRSYVNF